MGRAPAGRRSSHSHSYAAMLRELDGVRQEILQDLLKPLGVGGYAAYFAIDRDIERKTAALGLVAEWAGDGLPKQAERDVFSVHRHCAGFNFREVEDIADEIQ